VHKREKHTFANTKDLNCICCKKDFKSPVFNVNKNKYYDRCEECRELQKELNTRPLEHNTYVYGIQKDRYYIENGIAKRMCSVYTCFEHFPCHKHQNQYLIECNGTKCNNCYIENGLNQCKKCINRGAKSKNKLRNTLKDFKIQLGGQCVECGLNDLFFLEFDHIDKSKKIKQITRSSPNHWEKEKNNLQLLCGRCHRIKTSINHTSTNVLKEAKKKFVREIKKKIGGCQVCKWTIDDKDKMCSALDFDHLDNYDKVKQISNLYYWKRSRIVDEIEKTRVLCRHCHELWTCIQRGGKSIKYYYTEEEIEEFNKKLGNKQLQMECQREIKEILYS
jgi:hypothetical protein